MINCCQVEKYHINQIASILKDSTHLVFSSKVNSTWEIDWCTNNEGKRRKESTVSLNHDWTRSLVMFSWLFYPKGWGNFLNVSINCWEFILGMTLVILLPGMGVDLAVRSNHKSALLALCAARPLYLCSSALVFWRKKQIKSNGHGQTQRTKELL